VSIRTSSLHADSASDWRGSICLHADSASDWRGSVSCACAYSWRINLGRRSRIVSDSGQGTYFKIVT
jgi:hypothetical protein